MSIVNRIKEGDFSCCSISCFDRVKSFADDIHEFFTHHKATIQKIESLNQRIFQVEAQLYRNNLKNRNFDKETSYNFDLERMTIVRAQGMSEGQNYEIESTQSKTDSSSCFGICSLATLNTGMFGLKELLVEEAQFYNQNFLNRKIKHTYEQMRNNLERVRKSVSEQSIRAWAGTDRQKTNVSRWLLSNASQRHFAVHYHLDEVPLKFNEIPAGSIVLTDPYAYLKHMKLEKKFPIIHSVILKIKALFCRFLTGKQFTHVGFAMGEGKMFELEKKSDTWIRGNGLVKNCWDKVFYGVVLAPKQHVMLEAHNKHFPDAPCASFQELMTKINAEIIQATEKHRVQLDVLDIIKTVVPKKRRNDYDPSQAWKEGSCHFSCSGTTSALLSFTAGMDIGGLYNKTDDKVTPTDFYHCRKFYYPIYSIS